MARAVERHRARRVEVLARVVRADRRDRGDLRCPRRGRPGSCRSRCRRRPRRRRPRASCSRDRSTSRHRFAPHAVAVPLGGAGFPHADSTARPSPLSTARREQPEHEDFIARIGSRSAGNGSLARMKIARAHDSYTSARGGEPQSRRSAGLVEQRAQRLGVHGLRHVAVEAGGERGSRSCARP